MHPSASFYTTSTLRLYDFVVLIVSNSLAWRCPTRSILLPFYQKHIKESSVHLEIGVGTSYYPSAATSSGVLSKTQLITLCDLNPNTLVYAKSRITRAGYNGSIETLQHNMFQPLAQGVRGKYDSVALYYLFHCLPGSFPQKAIDAFAAVAPARSGRRAVRGYDPWAGRAAQLVRLAAHGPIQQEGDLREYGRFGRGT